jgi:hypothetical protein
MNKFVIPKDESFSLVLQKLPVSCFRLDAF